MKHILRCIKCADYTMNEKCKCGGKAVTVAPPKYSPDDKYGKYRRETLKKELVERGLI